MKRNARLRTYIIRACRFLILALCASTASAQTIRYQVALENPAEHLVRVNIELPPGAAERDLQLPVWNALYQVRDFAQYVNWVRAEDSSGRPLTIRKLNKSLWQINGTEAGVHITYDITARLPGPYGTELSRQHAFFNLAEILMYPVNARSAPMEVRFSNIPKPWHIATSMPACSSARVTACFQAENYDRLVDSPVEIGEFAESDFDEGGARYRIIVDADWSDYDMQKIVAVVRRIVIAATGWMNDQPYQTYVFIYHFPRATLYGGMEHGFSTAITLNAQVLSNNPDELADVTAHEFFHLWNVKRIRPQSLEPVDYTKENYCDALWFSEGVTSTVSSYILLRAGLLDEFRYIRRLADAIETLESRPAHLTQSARESSIDAWLEKYAYYNLPERSISYYNKGELLGVLLDLAMRDSTSNHASLRDLFHSMNSAAKLGHFFADSQGVQRAAEALSQSSFAGFFEKYVAGTTEVPWNDFFRTVGLQVVKYQIQVPDVGFSASRSFDALPSVQSVVPDGGAERAGLQVGDSIVEINGSAPAPHIEQQLGALPPGDKLRVRVRNARGERELQWLVGSRQAVEFELKDVNNITPQQKARRAAWLKGESEGEQRP